MRTKTPENRRKNGSFNGPLGPPSEVGLATQFKPGQSGNPGGRPKSREVTEAYLKFGRLSPDEYKKTKPATMFEKRAKDIISAGSKNLIPAVREMTDRVEGKSYIVVQNNMLIANFDDGERTRVQDTMNKLREIAELE